MPGTLTQAQIYAEVVAGLGNRVDTQLTPVRITNAMNLAQQRISRYYSFPELRADWIATGVITGNPVIDKWLVLPPNIRVIHSFILQDEANSRKLIEKPWRQFDYNVPLPEFVPQDWPSYYTRFDLGVAMLFPIPLSAFMYFLRATMLPTPFTQAQPQTSTQLSDFVDKDDIIIDLATSRLWKTLSRPDLALSLEKDALIRLGEAKASAEDYPDMDYSPDDMTGGVVISSTMYWASPFVMAVDG